MLTVCLAMCYTPFAVEDSEPDDDFKRHERKNLRDGILLLVVIIIIDLLLCMAGGSVHWGPIMH